MADGSAGARTIQAEMLYFKTAVGKPSFGAINNGENETRLMTVHDASSWSDPPTLDREGIALINYPSVIKDFSDRDAVKSKYGDELAELMRSVTGAKYAFGFGIGHMRFSKRRPEDAPSGGRPASLAHVDVTPRSAPGIGAHNAFYRSPPEVLKPGQRLVGYNIWRILSEPPHDIPLGVCDQRSVAPEDLVASDGVYGTGADEVRSEAYLVRHNPKHRWIFFSGMKPGDAMIFRSYESGNRGYPGVPHAAFYDPTCPATAVGRVSVEGRAYVIFDE